MKLQLDTSNKTIKLESSVKLSTLIETLSKLLPNNEWKSFTIETNTFIYDWHEPIYIRNYPRWNDYPWYYTSSSSTKTNTNFNDKMLCAGTFNVSV